MSYSKELWRQFKSTGKANGFQVFEQGVYVLGFFIIVSDFTTMLLLVVTKAGL